jgi:ribonuclease J
MLFRHKEFVKNHLGYAEENIVLIENGDVLELDGERATITDKKEIKRTFIDDSGFEEIEYETVRERKKMAYEGIITLVMTIDRETGELGAPPKIVAQGVRGFEANGQLQMAVSGEGRPSKNLAKEAELVISAAVAGASRQTFEDRSLLKEHVRLELKRFIQRETGAKPVILPVFTEV